MSKGSKQRPRQIGRDQWRIKWNKTFSPKCFFCLKQDCECITLDDMRSETYPRYAGRGR